MSFELLQMRLRSANQVCTPCKRYVLNYGSSPWHWILAILAGTTYQNIADWLIQKIA